MLYHIPRCYSCSIISLIYILYTRCKYLHGNKNIDRLWSFSYLRTVVEVENIVQTKCSGILHVKNIMLHRITHDISVRVPLLLQLAAGYTRIFYAYHLFELKCIGNTIVCYNKFLLKSSTSIFWFALCCLFLFANAPQKIEKALVFNNSINNSKELL